MAMKMQKLLSLLPNSGSTTKTRTTTTSTTASTKSQFQCSSSTKTTNKQKANLKVNHLEPEIGFQISIEFNEHIMNNNGHIGNSGGDDMATANCNNTIKTIVPELNVHLIAARHLPTLFGFKIVQGYMIKVKLFPGSKRLESSMQTNSWPKFNENFKFPLAPDVKPSLKQHISHRGSKSTIREFTPQELFAGQFVVFTVYALLQLPPTTFNRFNKTYRSLKDKSTNLMQNIFEGTTTTASSSSSSSSNEKENKINQLNKRKSMDCTGGMPALTISEARRNLGSVTCYLEPKIFQRNSKGVYTTEELWQPIKDITTTITTSTTTNANSNNNNLANNNLGNNSNNYHNNNNLTNAPKGVVELVLELKENIPTIAIDATDDSTTRNYGGSNTNTNHSGNSPLNKSADNYDDGRNGRSYKDNSKNAYHGQSWNRMTSQVRRKMGLSNISNSMKTHCPLILKVITTRMRCSNKAKDELEHTAGSVYVKTTVFERGIYLDSWKSSHFYPSISTKWCATSPTLSPTLRGQCIKEKMQGDDNEHATIMIPLRNLENLDDILIKTTLATKTKLGKKLILGTVIIGHNDESDRRVYGGRQGLQYSPDIPQASGVEHMKLLRQSSLNELVSMWHCYQ